MNSLETDPFGLLTFIVAPAILTKPDLIPDVASRTGNPHPCLGRDTFKSPMMRIGWFHPEGTR
jgi:hypothetical protein